MFITFEGGEASGKSTQIQKVRQCFESLNKPVVLTREPGGTAECELIRNLLLHHQWEPTTEAFLFNASRHEHMKTLIEPALAAGKTVLCDRFMDSTMVYQGYGLGMSLAFLKTLQDHAVNTAPDLTFIFDLDPGIALKRLVNRGDNNHIDNRSLDFHQKVRAGFLTLAQQNSKRCHVIDAAKDQETIFHLILEKIQAHQSDTSPQ
ncbi:MAG: dTMP kinase [Alphaproteobacteria bacterium]|nr:dTMP kinase [Alphaproteobacteria bacterium]